MVVRIADRLRGTGEELGVARPHLVPADRGLPDEDEARVRHGAVHRRERLEQHVDALAQLEIAEKDQVRASPRGR